MPDAIFAADSSIAADAGLKSALRAPLQGRSRESYERMLLAAEKLLEEHQSGDFTLNDVSKAGKVSIGSIYNRFESKDALFHAVQLRVLTRVDQDMLASLNIAGSNYRDLDHLVVRLVTAFADTLEKHSGQMRPLMQIASVDSHVAATGKASYQRTAKFFCDALLDHRDEIGHRDPDRAVDASFRILYSAIARYLGFGSATTAAWEGDWDMLKEDIAQMIVAFLKAPATPR